MTDDASNSAASAQTGSCAEAACPHQATIQKFDRGWCYSHAPLYDPVERPAHYARGEIQPLAAIEDWGLGFHLGQVVKYVARAGKKDGEPELRDLRKALVYLRRRIELLEKEAGRP